jgi:hypothetical protein
MLRVTNEVKTLRIGRATRDGLSTSLDQGKRKKAAPSETKESAELGCFALEVGMRLGGLTRWMPIGGLTRTDPAWLA